MFAEKLPIAWLPRSAPLSPLAAMVPRAELEALSQRELSPQLRALWQRDGLILFGPEDVLPFTRGVRYFGRDERAASLWLPTHSVPDLPLELFERCVRKCCSFSGPILVDAKTHRFVGLSAARPLTRAILRSLLEPRPSVEELP